MKNRKRMWWFLPGLLLAASMLLLLPKERLAGWESPEELPSIWARQLKREILSMARDCPAIPARTLSREALDGIEDHLIRLGYAVEDSDGAYPSYLANTQGLRDFLANASAGKPAFTSFFRIREDGGFGVTGLLHENGETLCVLSRVQWDGDTPCIQFLEVLPVYDMELADWGTFYYRLYPEDPHYIDYMQLRLLPPNRENYDLCRKYILPIGYQMVNFFLVDWEEGNWGAMSFPDVFEYLYGLKTGHSSLNWTDYVDPGNRSRARIPQELFEDTMLSFFRISREELRKQADWKEGSYPWRTFFGDDVTSRSYPMCEPVVTGVTEHENGTFTLSVRVSSPEKKTDCLFSHAVTIRPLADGSFQYVSNQVTDVGQWGLPYRDSRFMLDF